MRDGCQWPGLSASAIRHICTGAARSVSKSARSSSFARHLIGSEIGCQLTSWGKADPDTAVLADREVELAGSAYRGGGSCPGRRLGTSSNGVEPAQALGDGA